MSDFTHTSDAPAPPADMHVRRVPFDGHLPPMPKFSALAIHIRAALYGYRSELVQAMVDRNATARAMEQAGVWV